MLPKPIPTAHTPESLAEQLQGEPGLMLMHGAPGGHTLVLARPFMTFRALGDRCERAAQGAATKSNEVWRRSNVNPWEALSELLGRFRIEEPVEPRLPAGGVFGYWGYGLRRFLEPKLSCALPACPAEVPDASLGFYSSLVAFPPGNAGALVISTGLDSDGRQDSRRAKEESGWWEDRLLRHPGPVRPRLADVSKGGLKMSPAPREFMERVRRAQDYIRRGHIYQVNLSHQIRLSRAVPGWELYRALLDRGPAPHAAYLNCGEVSLASASPELFLSFEGDRVETRPIKGTRPRGRDATHDAELEAELRGSAKERAELVMITDLLRNDLGKVCRFGSVRVPELVRLEKFSHVQHLMSVVQGELRAGVSHLDALAACFPGGSITGAPKFRAMEIIEELETVARGPYTGALGYLGFNRNSRLSIIIRTAVCTAKETTFHTGAGIVADSIPELEYDETLAKAAGFFEALGLPVGMGASS